MPSIMTIDVTVSCPILPSLLADAASDATTLFLRRATEKNEKHLAGCVDMGRAFLPIVFSTLGGIGPPAAWDFIDSLFTASFVRERLAGGSGHATAQRKMRLIHTMQAALVRGSCNMVQHLTAPPSSE